MMTGKFIPYLVTFLNSQLFKFCFRDNFVELGDGWEVRKIFIRKIPAKKPTEVINYTCKKILENLIQSMNTNKQIHDFEAKLNKIIYDQYKITYEERKLIKRKLPSHLRI